MLPSTSTNAAMEDSSKSKKKQASTNPPGKTHGRKLYSLDADGNKIRLEKENQKTGLKQKRNQINNLAKNFLLTYFYIIAGNNLNN